MDIDHLRIELDALARRCESGESVLDALGELAATATSERDRLLALVGRAPGTVPMDRQAHVRLIRGHLLVGPLECPPGTPPEIAAALEALSARVICTAATVQAQGIIEDWTRAALDLRRALEQARLEQERALALRRLLLGLQGLLDGLAIAIIRIEPPVS